MTSYVTACQLSVHSHRVSLTPLYSIRHRKTHSGASIARRRDQSHIKRRQSCYAASSQQQEQLDKKLPYGILPLEAETKRTYEATDRWAALIGLVALGIWLYRGKAQLSPWVMQKIQQLDIPGCLAVAASFSTAFFYCKNRAVDLWCKQQRRVTYVDIIPVLASNVATLKQDVATLKQDVATLKQDVGQIRDDVKDIKHMLSQPWYKMW